MLCAKTIDDGYHEFIIMIPSDIAN